MSTILITGIDSTLGANLAAHFAEDYHVVGLAGQTKIEPEGVETIVSPQRDVASMTRLLDDVHPEWVICAEPVGTYCWLEPGVHQVSPTRQLESARALSRLTAERSISLTYLSCDAIFTGPWMFHEEEGSHFCQTTTAELYRQLESEVMGWNPEAMVVRSNTYGWTPKGISPQGVSRLAQDVAIDKRLDLDCMRHATPIHAVQLADLLLSSFEHDLSGLYHIAGAERVNPWQFMNQLMLHLEGPRVRVPYTVAHEIASEEHELRYGYGETSLQTKKIKAALGRSMPMLTEGLELLRAQRDDGFLDRLNGKPTLQGQAA